MPDNRMKKHLGYLKVEVHEPFCSVNRIGKKCTCMPAMYYISEQQLEVLRFDNKLVERIYD